MAASVSNIDLINYPKPPVAAASVSNIELINYPKPPVAAALVVQY